MSLEELIHLCRKFAGYGSNVGEQIADAVEGHIKDNLENWNPACGRYLREFLTEVQLFDPDLLEECKATVRYVRRKEEEAEEAEQAAIEREEAARLEDLAGR